MTFKNSLLRYAGVLRNPIFLLCVIGALVSFNANATQNLTLSEVTSVNGNIIAYPGVDNVATFKPDTVDAALGQTFYLTNAGVGNLGYRLTSLALESQTGQVLSSNTVWTLKIFEWQPSTNGADIRYWTNGTSADPLAGFTSPVIVLQDSGSIATNTTFNTADYLKFTFDPAHAYFLKTNRAYGFYFSVGNTTTNFVVRARYGDHLANGTLIQNTIGSTPTSLNAFDLGFYLEGTAVTNVSLGVTVNPANFTACSGGSASFTATAEGTPSPTVQWQVSASGGSFTNISGATNTTLTFTASSSLNGNQYRAVFTNSSGSINTTEATLTVSAAPSALITVPATNFASGSISNVASGPASLTGYAWSITNGTITSATNIQNITFTAGTSGSVGLTLTTSNSSGCSASSSTNIAIMTAPGAGTAISIDFGADKGGKMAVTELAGIAATTNWTSLSNAVGSASGLTDNSGANTGASVSWNCSNTWTDPVANTAGDYKMMRGYLDTSSTSGATVTVTNIPTTYQSSGYDVIVYCDGDNGAENRVGQYTIAGQSIYVLDMGGANYGGFYVQGSSSSDQGTLTSVGNFVRFSNLTNSGFTLTTTPGTTSGSNKRAPVNGMQIVQRTYTNTTAYDSLNRTALAGTGQSNTLNAVWGDRLLLAEAGVLKSFGLTLFNDSTLSQTGRILSATAVVKFYDNTIPYGGAGTTLTNPLLGTTTITWNFNSPGLAAGSYSPKTVDLSSLNIVLPKNILVMQQVTNVVGTSTRNGVVLMSDSLVGSSPNDFYVKSDNTSEGLYVVAGNASNGQLGYFVSVSSPAAPVMITNLANQTVCAGNSVSLMAAASGIPTPAAQWQSGYNGTYTNIPNATNATYVLSAAAGDDGRQFRTVFTNLYGSVTSSVATLTVNAATASITANPAGVLPNSTGNQASGPGGMVSYAWSITNGTITSATNVQTITYDAGAGANVALTLTITNGLGCSDSRTVNVPIVGNSAPTLTSVATLTNAVEDVPFTITYSNLLSSSDAADANGDTIFFRIESILSGTLTRNGTNIVTGSTLLGTNETLVWTAATNANGVLPAFTIVVTDGQTNSTTPVQVNVSVAAVNDRPVLVNPIPAQSGTYGDFFSYTFPSDTFTDVDSVLTYSFGANEGYTYPTWASFDAATRTFSGTPTGVANYGVIVFGSDGSLSAFSDLLITVGKAALTVTVDDVTRGFGQSNPTLTGSILGLKNGDNIAATFSTTATESSPAGTYPITVTLVDPQNRLIYYNVSTNLGTLTITNYPSSTTDPHADSWLTNYAGQYVRLYTNTAARNAGVTVTTWTFSTINGTNVTGTQALPVYSGIQEIYSSSNWVYIRASAMPVGPIGPLIAYGNAALLLPYNQKALYRVPKNATYTSNKSLTPGGAIGYFVDGVQMFDTRDALSWTGSNESQGTGYWTRDAYINEGYGFDPYQGHASPQGAYHYHSNPQGLRYLLKDHVDYDPATKTYSESTSPVTNHSPIVGWMRDGYPLYGPYGYSSASNALSGVRRMLSGFVLRNGQNGTANLSTTGRTNIPPWAQRLYGTNNVSGPLVASYGPLGRYLEDSDFMGDLINPSTGSPFVKGVDYDLDEYNGRWCVTPEFPNGTYAYFVTIETNGAPKYPYYIGRALFGIPSGGTVSNITETVVTNFLGATNMPLQLATPGKNGNTVSLAWSGIDGGTYKVESSTNPPAWTTLSTSATAPRALGGYTNVTVDAMNLYRVSRTAVAPFDSTGTTVFTTASVAPGGSAARGSTVTITITLPSSPPNPPTTAIPTSVTLAGTISGTSISHPATNTVLATFAIPGGATTGSQNIVVTFTPNPAYTLTNAFTILP